VVEHGGAETFVRLLATTTNEDLREQAIWALGNISGDTVALRDLLLRLGALPLLLSHLNTVRTLTLTR
jgi:importin subunit alpha-6/7